MGFSCSTRTKEGGGVASLGFLCEIQPNKDEFEPTNGLSVSGMACVWGSCPTLLVETESHQHINPSAKCISTLGLTLLREARTKA